jgi:hypothetical protein
MRLHRTAELNAELLLSRFPIRVRRQAIRETDAIRRLRHVDVHSADACVKLLPTDRGGVYKQDESF